MHATKRQDAKKEGVDIIGRSIYIHDPAHEKPAFEDTDCEDSTPQTGHTFTIDSVDSYQIEKVGTDILLYHLSDPYSNTRLNLLKISNPSLQQPNYFLLPYLVEGDDLSIDHRQYSIASILFFETFYEIHLKGCDSDAAVYETVLRKFYLEHKYNVSGTPNPTHLFSLEQDIAAEIATVPPIASQLPTTDCSDAESSEITHIFHELKTITIQIDPSFEFRFYCTSTPDRPLATPQPSAGRSQSTHENAAMKAGSGREPDMMNIRNTHPKAFPSSPPNLVACGISFATPEKRTTLFFDNFTPPYEREENTATIRRACSSSGESLDPTPTLFFKERTKLHKPMPRKLTSEHTKPETSLSPLTSQAGLFQPSVLSKKFSSRGTAFHNLKRPGTPT